MNNVILLDFDGPLFSSRAIRFLPKNHALHPSVKDYCATLESQLWAQATSYIWMDPIAVAILNKVYQDYPYEIVVSSSWAEFSSRDELRRLFDMNGIEAEFHDDWVTPRERTSFRITEVSQWIRTHPLANYVCIDDPQSGDYLVDEKSLLHHSIEPERVIIVDPEIGIESHHYDKIVELFDRTYDETNNI
jgi:hypothetical protein